MFTGSGALIGLAAFLAAEGVKSGTLMSQIKEIPGIGSKVPANKGLRGLLEESSGREDYPSAETTVFEGAADTYQLAG